MDDLENQFIDRVSQELCLDATREEFARETFKKVLSLTKGCSKDSVAIQRLLMGRKGVGKTFFLKKLQKVAKILFKENLIAIYSDYSNPEKQEMPYKLILNGLNNNLIEEVICHFYIMILIK